MAPDKKILLISYHFPPSTAVGGLRIAGFTKYLPDTGWTPYVLTMKNGRRNRLDMDRQASLGSVATFTAPRHMSVRDLYLELKSSLASLSRRKKVTPEELEETYVRPDPASAATFTARTKNLIASLLFLPDEKRSWITPATLRAIRLIRRGRIGYVLTSCPPYSVNLVGLALKSLFPMIKWVADFRDPWMIPVPKVNYPKSALSVAIEKKLEKSVIGSADLVLTTTDALAAAYAEHYKDFPIRKFHFIPNGYDSSECPEARSLGKYEKFTITYTGSLYLGRTPQPLFQAVSQLVKAGAIESEGIQIKLIGSCRYLDGAPIENLIETYGLKAAVEVTDQVSHMEALRIVGRSHLSLLLAPKQPYQIPAKAYDYIGVGTPILALTEKGATEDFINSTAAGRAISPDDIEGIKAFICEHMRGEGSFNPPLDSLSHRYQRKDIVQRFVRELERL